MERQRERGVCMSRAMRYSETTHVTRHTSHVTRHTSHVTRHTSHVTRHTSHVTRHTSHVTHHTSHVTRDTSHVTREQHLLRVQLIEAGAGALDEGVPVAAAAVAEEQG